MQQLPAWAKRKTTLFTIIALVAGTILIAWTWAGRLSAAPAIDNTIVQESTEAPLEAQAADAASSNPASTADTPTAASAVIVYVSGAVRAPDVYQLSSEARIKDLILAAGGFSADADPEQINLAERLKDGQHVRVPRRGDPAPSSGIAEDAAGTQPAQGGLVNINTASAAELDGLPGIGQSIAQRIVEYRTANGAFKSVEDLQNVKGIGPALFAKIAPLVTVGP
jgi:competence protein ComEA